MISVFSVRSFCSFQKESLYPRETETINFPVGLWGIENVTSLLTGS